MRKALSILFVSAMWPFFSFGQTLGPIPAASGGACVGCVTTGVTLTSGQLVTGAGGSAIGVGDLSGDATTSGSTTVTVVKVNGVAYSALPSTHTVPIITASNTATYTSIPDCSGSLGFTQSTNVFPCNPPPVTQTFTSQTSVAITHTFGTTTALLVQCYDASGIYIIPNTITLTNSTTVTVTFTNSQSGACMVSAGFGGSGGGGVTQLTGDVTAGPGTGSIAATVVKVNGASVPTSAKALASNGSNQLIAATYQGNGAKVQLSTGTTTTDDCVKFDANGNTVDAGAACGSGSGGGVNSGLAGQLAYYAADGSTVSPVTGIATKTSTYNVLATDYTLLCDASGGSFTLTLPASPNVAELVNIKKIDSTTNICTIDGNGSNIDADSSTFLTSQYDSFTLQFDGTQWWKL